MADVVKAIDRLLERTNQNRINWKVSETPGSFNAAVGKLAVSIAVQKQNWAVAPEVQFRIVDEDGKVIQSLNADHINDAAVYGKLRELHLQAGQAAQGNAASWDELLAELERV